jgi:hypothetical protein
MRNSFLVEVVTHVFPQEAQVTCASKTVGWISAFMLRCLSRDDIYALASMHYVEHHDPVRDGEQGIVFTNQYIKAWLDLSAALAHKNIARKDKLTGVTLYTQTLGVAVTTVAG